METININVEQLLGVPNSNKNNYPQKPVRIFAGYIFIEMEPVKYPKTYIIKELAEPPFRQT